MAAMDSARTHSFRVLDPAFDKILPTGAALRAVATGFEFTEGPAWLADGQFLIFSDIPADTLYRWAEGEGHRVWRRPSHHANGNTADAEGRLLTCEHGSRRLTRTRADGEVTVLATHHAGRRLNSPNDVVVKSDGTVWFTDPPYGIPPEAKEQDSNNVFRLDTDSSEPVAVVCNFVMPNGLCFSPDEQLLYIADSDSSTHHVRRFAVGAGNLLTGGEVFVTIDSGVPDGMCVDRDGRLYCTAADGVRVFSTEGVHLGTIMTPEVAANCAFGGQSYGTLFITATSTVWAVDLATSGMQPRG